MSLSNPGCMHKLYCFSQPFAWRVPEGTKRVALSSIGNTFSDFNTVFELYAYLTRHVLWLVCTGVGSPPFTLPHTCTLDSVVAASCSEKICTRLGCTGSPQIVFDISHCFAFLNWIEDWIELRGLQHRHSCWSWPLLLREMSKLFTVAFPVAAGSANA